MRDRDLDTDIGDPKDRNFVTSLARGLDVLRCFRPTEAQLSNTDISTRTGLPKPTVSRLTHTLCKLEYLVTDTQTGSYRLGAGVLQLGFGVLSGMEIGARASDVLGDLGNGPNTNITAALGERFRDQVIYVAVRQSREDVALAMHVGSRLPLFHSAIGRAILVGLPPDEREILFEEAAKQDPENEKNRRDSYAKAESEYGNQGFCTGYGDWRPDVNGIAVPVFSLNGSRVYGLNVGGPSFHVDRHQLETDYGSKLIEAAQALSLHR